MKSLFKRKSSKPNISNNDQPQQQHIGQPPPGGFISTNLALPPTNEDEKQSTTSKYDGSFEIGKLENNVESTTDQQQTSSDQQPTKNMTRRLSFKRGILGSVPNQPSLSNNSTLLPPLPTSNSVPSSATSPRFFRSATPSSPRRSNSPTQSMTIPSLSKKPQPAHYLTLQLEDLLATSYKNRSLPVQKYVFIIDFSFSDTEELYNNVKKAHISYIHAKNQSSWNFASDSGLEVTSDANLITLAIMGMSRSSILPVWNSDNEKLLDLHQRQGFIRLDDKNLKKNTSYCLNVKQVLDCCEYLNTNSNFLMTSNPYEENQDVINLDIFAQYIVQNLIVSDIHIVSSYIERDNVRASISHQTLYELEKLLSNTSNSLYIDFLKITNRHDLGILSVPLPSSNNEKASSSGIVFNDRVIFDSLEHFLKRIRQQKSHDFTFAIGIGKSDIIRTNKELEFNLSKCFSLFTVNPKLRSNSISFYEDSSQTNPLSDYIYHL